MTPDTLIPSSTYPLWVPMSHMPTFEQRPFTIVRAAAASFWDEHAKQYLDFTSGLWNVPLGYDNDSIITAIADQLRQLSYANPFGRASEPALDLSERLLDVAPGPFQRVFFNTSGSSAIDTTMKLVRRTQRLRGHADKNIIVGLQEGYHGTHYGAMALTGQDIEQRQYDADRRGIRHVGVNDMQALEALFAKEGAQIAAVVLEPVLGNGCVPLSEDFLSSVFHLTRQHGVLVVADEVATGFGRTGTMFASSTWQMTPDVLVLSKAINNGYLPLSATLVSHEVASAFDESGSIFLHGETQSGNPAACAAALSTLAILEKEETIERISLLGGVLDECLLAVRKHPAVKSTSGRGLMRSVSVDPSRFTSPTVLVTRLREQGIIVYPAPAGIMLLPPFIVDEDDVARVCAEIVDALDVVCL